MIGRTLGHYRIVEEIGKGGMGVVYRARDERLDRDVAVKVLPAGTLADDAARQRFRKEALALSKLNHPNIQTVHDFDTQDGVDFLVTEYVPGATLNERVAGKGLPEKEVLRLGQQLAEGLAAAHEQGIIHRDLKPANLRVTPDGRLKILDFGVAKLLAPVGATAATETAAQTVAGTPLYMAPEQRRGEPVDARTDLYAAGLVLWEMATGKPPVAGRALSGSVSPGLQRIAEKCLEEEPENRYQSAKELAVDLRRLAAPTPAPSPQAPAWGRIGSRWQVPPGSAALVLRVGVGLAAVAVVLALLLGLNAGGLREKLFGPATPKIDSLAVLPLDNLSRDPEQEYFADGMTEALTAELSKISALKVISRTSAMQYKGVKKPLPQIARELGVTGLIEGSVAREGDQVRITVQLIHGPTDKHLWVESYQRELRGILALQSEVARAVAREIRITLTPKEQLRLASVRPVNPEAYEAYLKARYHWNRWPRGTREAMQFYREAIEKDPNYALPHAGLALCYSTAAYFVPPKEVYPKARAAALKALEIDDNLPEGHMALGEVKLQFDWDWAGAERSWRHALELDPNNVDAHRLAAGHLITIGRLEEGLAQARRARELDPLSPLVNGELGWALYRARQYDQAIAQYEKTLEIDPDNTPSRWQLAWIYTLTGRHEAALAEFNRAGGGRAWEGFLYAKMGRESEARQVAENLERLSAQQYVDAYAVAIVYAGLGDKDRAFAWLARAYEERSAWMSQLKGEQFFDPLRDDPRFQALLRRMNFPD